MRIIHALLGIAAGCLLGSAAIVAAQTAPPKPQTHVRAAGSASPYLALATVHDLMGAIIDPASKVVFGAVSSVDTPAGTKEKAPGSDAEWAVVRRNALLMVEAANLLMIPGRHIAPPELAKVHKEGELPPVEIEARVGRDRTAWNEFAAGFRQAAIGAVRAAEARKPEAFGPVNEAIDTACENCHLRFWYPEQEELLKNAPKPK